MFNKVDVYKELPWFLFFGNAIWSPAYCEKNWLQSETCDLHVHSLDGILGPFLLNEFFHGFPHQVSVRTLSYSCN